MLASVALALALQAAPPEQRYLRISFNPRNRDATMLRAAAPAGEIEPWFKLDGAAFRAIRGFPPRSLPYANGTFTVDDKGRVSDCAADTKYERNADTIAFGEAICADLRANGRFVPALDSSGRRVATTIGLFGKASDRRGLWGEGGDNPPLVGAMPLPPAPPMPPNYWTSSWNAGHYQVSGARLFSGDRSLVAAGALRWTGLSLTMDTDGKTTCVVSKSSGDPREDLKACKIARKYKLTLVGTPRYLRGAMVMMVHDRGKPSALMPIRKEALPARLTAAGTARIGSILSRPIDDNALSKRVDAHIDRSGSATRCSITASDGNDGADIALCRALKNETLLTPAEDIFGLPGTDWL